MLCLVLIKDINNRDVTKENNTFFRFCKQRSYTLLPFCALPTPPARDPKEDCFAKRSWLAKSKYTYTHSPRTTKLLEFIQCFLH